MKRLVRESLDEEPYVDYEEPDVDEFGTIRWRNEDGELHREDGPAIEWASGSKEWWVNHKRHREDGPAIEWASGSKEWWVNDKRHREDGPAIEFASGNKYWYINNELHREDGPAVEYANGNKYWYINGKLHREDGPALEYADGLKSWWLNNVQQPDYFGKKPVRESLDEEPYVEYEEVDPEINWNGTKRWYNEDRQLHREDGPAVEYTSGTKEWFMNGMRHREGGPAIEDADGTKFWCINDKLHREDGPAIEWAYGRKEWWLNGESQLDYFGKKPVRESLDEEPYVEYEEHEPEINRWGNKRWYNEDRQLHREDGPAVEYASGYKEWWLNNKLHREDGPAIEWPDGTKYWYLNNVQQPDYFGKKPVRESLDEEPYVDYEEHDPEIDRHGDKYWYNENRRLHREDGPAIVRADGSKSWFINGKLHREDGPAVEHANGNKSWYINDKRHREDGPAIEFADGTKSWYIDDKLHREDGPARIWANGAKAWYLNGIQQPDYFSKKPVRESLVEEPYVEYEEHDPEINIYGTKRWYNEDRQLHREDGPAIEFIDGDKFWYLNGERHREDGPAVEYVDGTKHWYLNGERQPEYFGKKPVRESLHEEPYYIEYEEHEPEINQFGVKHWYNERRQLHREDGPALEWPSGSKSWLLNGKHHREDGPAIIWSNGDKEWWLNGERQPDYFGKKQNKNK